MSQWPATQLSTESGRAPTADELLVNVKQLIEQFRSKSNATNRVVFSDTTSQYTLIVTSLSDMLSQFPTMSSKATKKELDEAIPLARHSLEAIELVSRRMEGALAGQEYALTSKLLVCLGTIEEWEQSNSNTFQAPYELRDNIIRVLTGLFALRVTETFATEQKYDDGLSAIKNSLEEIFSTFNATHASLTSIYPDTLTLFENPTKHSMKVGQEGVDSKSVQLVSVHHARGFCLTLLQVVLSFLQTSSTSSFFFENIIRQLIESINLLFDSFLNFSDKDIHKCFVRLLSLTLSLTQLSPYRTAILQSQAFRLLRVRIDLGEDPDWEPADEKMADVLDAFMKNMSLVVEPIDNIREFVSGWLSRTDSILKSAVINYLKYYLRKCPLSSLEVLNSGIDQIPPSRSLESLQSIITQRLGDPMIIDVSDATEDDWEPSAIEAIRSGFGLPTNGGSNHLNSSGSRWQTTLIREINDSLSQRLSDTSEEGRLSLARNLSALPDQLLPPSDRQKGKHSPVSLLPLAILALSKLLRGPSQEVTSDVWRATLKAFTECLNKHRTPEELHLSQEIDIWAASQILHPGLTHANRPVRLAAGRVAVKLFETCQETSDHNSTSTILGSLARNIKHRSTHVRESALVTMGDLGSVARVHSLGDVCFHLTCVLGDLNPILRGVAFLQLSRLAQRHKSPWNLVAPDVARLSRHIAANCVKQPLLLNEFCRFISYSPSSFLSQTSQYFLPDLSIKCAHEELNTVSRILETAVASLIVEKPAEILEQIFMLKNIAQAEKALDFVVQNLQSANMIGQRSLGISNLVKIALLPLLGRLVIQLGDEDTRTRDLALDAIKRVEKHLSDSRITGKKLTPSMQPHIFLRSHVLGVVSYLNSELLDVHGKRPLEVKRKVLKGINEMIHIIGDAIAVASPQLVAIMQNTIHQQGLSMPTIQAWHALASVLPPSDFLPYLALTSAIFVKSWPTFDYESKLEAKQTLLHIVNSSRDFGDHLNVMASFSDIPELQGIQERVEAVMQNVDIRQKIERICPRIADINPAVSQLAILEARKLVSDQELFHPLISGDTFDPCIGNLVKVLHNVANREGEVYEPPRLLTFECLGIIGAVDPDRFELPRDPEDPILMFADLSDEKASQQFAIHLITDVLTPIFPRTSDIKFQSQLAYTIQELLSFCGFTASLLSQEPESSISVKTRARWKSLPDDVRATIAPLLNSKFTVEGSVESTNIHPIYPSTSTYREWIQKFSSFLIANAGGGNARRIFRPFHAILGSSDVQVLLFLLPNLVLHLLMGRSSEGIDHIRQEILCVLEDQVNPQTSHTVDMRLLCAQTIFQLMDHLNKYLRYLGVQMAQGRHRRHNKGEPLAERHKTAESLTTSIDHSLMAQAALQCKQYARALMSLEQRVAKMRSAEQVNEAILQQDYEKMHEIYAHLDEPDGMNGISALVLSPSLEHQIREHESTGRWTSAQSCWEVSLQQDPNSLDSHVGLLRCLRNLGHFDTLRTHLTGVLARNPDWADALEPFRLTGAWTAHDWGNLEEIVNASQNSSPELSTGKLLLALRTRDRPTINEALGRARLEFGQPIGAGGAQSYRRTYDANVHLHMVQDLSMIYDCMDRISQPEARHSRKTVASQVSLLAKMLDVRYEAVLPSYRTLEPILSLRRTAFDLLNQQNYTPVNLLVGDYWLTSSKIARKAGHFQAAYSALLQGRHRGAPYHFIQGCKLLTGTGDSIRALQELNNSLVLTDDGTPEIVIDLTESDEQRRMRAKAFLLRARWMQASERFSRAELNARFNYVTQLYEGWETSFFYWALYLDRSQTHKDVPTTQFEEYINQNDHVVRYYGRSLKYGSKHLYQTVPRMLTLWLNMGQREELQAQKQSGGREYGAALSKYGRLCEWIREDLAENVDPFKWLTAFPQIVSRLVNPNKVVARALYTIVGKVILEYAQQSLWILCGVSSSSKKERRDAAFHAMGFSVTEKYVLSGGTAERKEVLTAILNLVKPLSSKYLSINKELLNLCNFDVEQASTHFLEVKCPNLAKMSFSDVIVPLQDSFTTKIPPLSATVLQHQAFPHSLPTIKSFLPHIHVIPSLQKPRKIGIEASNGDEYFFLCKPKDDLRKDARLMDFNSVVNKLLRANSDSRRRQLHIRTYSVVPLNEECGLIEWVRNTMPLRSVLKTYYEAKGVALMPKKVMELFDKIKHSTPEQAAKIFEAKVLPDYSPPVFHEWFLETFPEPSAWFASRLAYSRTAAVISMVGYIIGLGDRHYENIMLDEVTGETVHCDFNCIFDKGKQFEVPELVPFRLTQNVVDGMGITRVEGCFRISCEITMQLLRSNQDCLMSVLEAFVHDPLVEWEDERRRKEKRVIGPADLRRHALGALDPIEKKLRGIESDRQVSVSNQVDKLIQAATSIQKLAKMYVGWNPWI